MFMYVCMCACTVWMDGFLRGSLRNKEVHLNTSKEGKAKFDRFKLI